MKKFSRKRFSGLLIIFMLILTITACGSNNNPSTGGSTETPADNEHLQTENTDVSFEKEITVIIPYSAGGEADNIFRTFESSISKHLGTNMVANFVTGGNGIPGVQQMLDSDPDGYTIALIGAGLGSIQPHLGTATYSTEDLQAICNLNAGPIIFAVDEKQPYQRFEEWLEAAKTTPGTMNYGSGSLGGTPHLAMTKIIENLNLDVAYVPFSGNAEAYASVLGGHTQGYVAIASSIVGKEGIRPLLNLGSVVPEGLENVPRLEDVGIDASLATDAYFGLVCSKNVDKKIVTAIEKAMEECLQQKEVIEKFENMKLNMYYLGAADFTTYMNEQSKGYKAVIDLLGLANK